MRLDEHVDTDPSSERIHGDVAGAAVLAAAPLSQGRFDHRVRRPFVANLVWSAPLAVLGLLILWPLAQLALRALEDNAAGLRAAARIPDIDSVVWSTVAVGAGSAAVALVVGTALAWCANRLPTRGARLLRLVPIMPLVLPMPATVIGWTFLASPRTGYLNQMLRDTPFFGGRTGPLNVYSVPWVVMLTGLSMSSFVYLFVHSSMEAMGTEVEGAAATCGASPVRTFFTITLPLLRPAIVYSAGIVFLLGLGQFTAPLLLGTNAHLDVLTTEMFRLTQAFPINYGMGAGLGFPLLVSGLLVAAVQRRTTANHKRFVTVGARTQWRAGAGHRGAAATILVYGAVAVALPLIALLHVGLSKFWTGSISLDGLTLEHFQSVLEDDASSAALRNSLMYSVGAVALTLPLGFVIAWGLVGGGRAPRMHRILLDGIAQLPLAIPASLLGFAFLFAFSRPPIMLYGTSLVVVLTYVALMVPHSVRLQSASLVGLGSEFWEASRACGAGLLRTICVIVLPLIRRSLASAAAIMVILLSHEFSASLMVRSARTNVLGGLLYNKFALGAVYSELAAVALAMVAVTAVGAALALSAGRVRRGRTGRFVDR